MKVTQNVDYAQKREKHRERVKEREGKRKEKNKGMKTER